MRLSFCSCLPALALALTISTAPAAHAQLTAEQQQALQNAINAQGGSAASPALSTSPQAPGRTGSLFQGRASAPSLGAAAAPRVTPMPTAAPW